MPDDKPLTNDEFKEQAGEEAAAAMFAVVHQNSREWEFVEREERNDWLRLSHAVADIRRDIWNGAIDAAANVLEARMSQFMTVAKDPFQHAGMRGAANERAKELHANMKVIQAQKILEDGDQGFPKPGLVIPG